MARLPQIGVPVSKLGIKTKFQEIVEKKFEMRMADFLRSVVEEVVETYGNLSVEEKVDFNLGNITIGGPRIVRTVLREWCRRNPTQARELDMARLAGDDGPGAGSEHKGKSKKSKAA